MIRRLGAALLAGAMFVSSSALAASSATPRSIANQGALTPGKAADVKQAQSFGGTAGMLLLGGGLVIGGIVLVLQGDGRGAVGSTTTCPLTGCPPPPPPPPPTTTTSTGTR